MFPRRLVFAVSVLLLVAALGVSPTGATFVSTSGYDAAVLASDDWTPPFVAVSTLPDYVSGHVAVGTAASDGRRLVASVELQYAAADTGSWTTLCVDTTPSYSCPWATTSVPDGPYQVRAIATDAAGLSTTSEVSTTRVVNSASVVFTNPGDPLHGSVPLIATFVQGDDARATMRFEYVVSGSTNWAAVPGCGNVAGVAVRTCTWVTSGARVYDLRAVAVAAGTTYYDTLYGVTVDNVAPSVALTLPAGTLAGTVDLTATADDADTGVDNVTFQYRPAGAAPWTTCGADTATPYTCPLSTTSLADGSYEFRAVATDLATNTATTDTQTRAIDNTVASVSITSPVAGTTVRGTVTVTADANSNQGVASVRIEVRPSAGVWAALCADTSAPYSCSRSTSTNGTYDVRAVLTQGNGSTLVSAVVSIAVDNAVLRAQGVQAVNSGTSGLPSTGDRLVLTYSTQVDPGTIKTGWTGAATTITVDLKDKKQAGALLAGYDRAEFAGTDLGQVAFPQNFVKNNLAASFTGSTMVATTETVGGARVTVVTVTLGTTSQSVNLHATTASAVMTWSPSVQVQTAAGLACSSTAAVESGATDGDL